MLRQVKADLQRILIQAAVTLSIALAGAALLDRQALFQKVLTLEEHQENCDTVREFPELLERHMRTAPETRKWLELVEERLAQCCRAERR